MNDRQSPVRTLVSAADGRVIPLGELYDTRYAKGAQGDGFAVLPPAGMQRLRLSAESAARARVSSRGPASGFQARSSSGYSARACARRAARRSLSSRAPSALRSFR